MCTWPLFISFHRAFLASSNVSTACPSSNDNRCILNYKQWKNKPYDPASKQIENAKAQWRCIITCAPWRTRISIPLLSIDIKAASSTSVSVHMSSLRGFEKIALSSCSKCKCKSNELQISNPEKSYHNNWKQSELRQYWACYDFSRLNIELSSILTPYDSSFIRYKLTSYQNCNFLFYFLCLPLR